MRHIDDDERRARAVARHHLGRTAPDVVAAVRGVVAQHSSDPITPPLAAWARVPDLSVAAWEHVMYDQRSLWRMHAMRRTLFVVPSDEAAIFDGAAGADVARKERDRLEKWVAEAELAEDVPAWIAAVERDTLAALDDGVERRTPELSEAVPALSSTITVGSGRWTTQVNLGSRLLMVMALDGALARSRPAGTWRSSQYHWVSGHRFAGHPGRFGAANPMPAARSRAELLRRYLATHGPATLNDLRWWTGWTVARTKAALKAVEAIEVALDGGAGFVLPDDVEVRETAARHVSLLPGLDSTTMGWKERDWYLGPHAGPLFDRNGNAGPTVWVDGRIVGAWAQREGGEVVFRLLEDVGREAERAVEAEAAALAGFFDGATVKPRFRTPLERELAG